MYAQRSWTAIGTTVLAALTSGRAAPVVLPTAARAALHGRSPVWPSGSCDADASVGPRRRPGSGPMTRLAVDRIACTGHGMCADWLGERIGVDEWGHPVIDDQRLPPELVAAARKAARQCPVRALRLVRETGDPSP